MFATAMKKLFGTKHAREVKKIQPIVDAVAGLQHKMKKLSDADLVARTADFRTKLDNGASLDDLLVPAFATVREASQRVLGMTHYDVQIVGGVVLHQGKIAEMRTGEGKTLVATLPCYLNGLSGKGVHVVTVNDYLARRDAEWMGRLHGFLGLETGVVLSGQGNAAKKRQYRADITYGQNNEFGFDYLRDNMKFSIHEYAQRELNFAIVDEVDSILVDEARTPLIISGPGETASEKYVRVNELIPKLRAEEHYVLDEKARSVTLTEEGMEAAQRLLFSRGLMETQNLYDPVNLETLHLLQQCLRAHTLYHRDQNYMVDPEGKVLIIDEFTGRVLPGRRWSDGLHQAVEAKERVPIQDENVTLATISFQNLFRLYDKLSGMTGTADTEAKEFHEIYELDVVVIPTNKPIIRDDGEDLVYKTEREKFHAVADEIADAHDRGQPVLVGTTSVEKSDALARLLGRRGIEHNVLNAKQHEREAYVVAQAGTSGAVTVATNMAGRGTDIVLGGNAEMLARMETLADPDAMDAAVEAAVPHYVEKCKMDAIAVKNAGGLYIVGTERHESRRIDNQLRGRAGRQGDPGTSRFYLSLEDDLMRIFAGDRIQTMMDRLGMEEGVPIEHKWVTKAVENAQKKVEERNFDIRKNLLDYDDVMNQQRKTIYELRRQVLRGQYRSVPSEEDEKKGIESKSFVEEADPKLVERIAPIVKQMVQIHGAERPPEGASPEEAQAYRERAMKTEIADLPGTRGGPLEKDVYRWFGCVTRLKRFKHDAQAAYDYLIAEVGLSLTEQRERLLDLIDEIISSMVERACPPNKHYEDWDLDGLVEAYEKQFGIECTGVESITDVQDLANKLYSDAEAILKHKEDDFGSESFLRLFRNFYLQEIDRQWMDHLQAMDSLRDGIGLRGYGQRDPKQEYKREGFDMFRAMMESIKTSVSTSMLSVERVREEDLERLEAQRRAQAEKRQRVAHSSHASTDGEEEAQGAPRAARRGGRGRRAAQGAPQAAKPAPLRRDRPKVGRNDPCWCGSGKKYKQCHLREDQRAGAELG